MQLGIVGLPNVGKSTLFNALTDAGAQSANYPFCTIEPNVGIVSVPDRRLEVLRDIYQPDSFVPATIEIVDIAGLVRGASKGEGLGNKFLGKIREVDAVVHVVRCFEDGEIIHVDGKIGPGQDIATINLELILADLEVLERRIDKAAKALKGDRKYEAELELFRRLKEHLDGENPARTFPRSPEEDKLIAEVSLLSNKPVLYAANLSEADFAGSLEDNKFYREVCEIAAAEGSAVLPVCAKIEEDLAGMTDDEKLLFLDDLGFAESGLDRLIRESYSLLGLISFLTAGKPEVRAWTIRRGTRAPQAAGKIHSDIERGFIRAEVVAFDALEECGSIAAAKEKGLVRQEGKEYIMQDGDVVLFRFNV